MIITNLADLTEAQRRALVRLANGHGDIPKATGLALEARKLAEHVQLRPPEFVLTAAGWRALRKLQADGLLK